MKRIIKSIAISVGGLASLAPNAVAAQETDRPSRSLGAGEIVVTANKLDARSASDTPIAVSAFSQDILDNMGAKGLSDFLQTAPGVSIVEGAPGNNYVQIRGASSVFGDPTVGLYLNDLPFALVGSGELPAASTLDLDRVEVLRGPQGTLYGASSLGGTIRILTKQPNLTKFSGNASASYSSIGHGEGIFRGTGVLNVPIVEDKLAVRFAVSYEDAGGWIDAPTLGKKDVNDTKSQVYRGALKWAVTDNLEANFTAWISRTKADSTGQSSANATKDYDLTLPFLLPVKSNYDLYNGTLSWDLGGVNVYSATSYMKLKLKQVLNFNPIPGYRITSDVQGVDVFSQEIRITSASENRLSWLLGAFYSNTDELVDNYVDPGNPLIGLFFVDEHVQNSRIRSKQYSLFGQLGYKLVPDKLEASVGLRYFKNDQSNTEFGATGLFLFGLNGLPATRKASFNDISPRFNLSYTPSKDTLIYATVAKGFRSGLIQGALGYALGYPNAPSDVAEESLWSYEIGLKQTLFDGQLYTELAAYRNDWKDVQTSSALGYIVNAGDSRAYGADFLFSYTPNAVKGLNVQVSGNWNDSTYVRIGPAGFGAFEKGNRVVLVPEWTLNGSLNYRHPLSDTLTGSIYLGVQYTDRKENRGTGLVLISDPVTLATARVGVEKGNYQLNVFVDNLLNEDGNMSPDISRPSEVVRPRPRTFGVEVKASF